MASILFKIVRILKFQFKWFYLKNDKSILVLVKVLVVFVNELTADDKYPVQDCENFQLPIQMILLEKRKTFSQFFFFFFFFFTFLESTSNFKLFEERIIVIANLFPKIETVKMLVRRLSKKCRCRTRFGSRHEKRCQILAKSSWKHFCHVFHHSEGSWFREYFP